MSSEETRREEEEQVRPGAAPTAEVRASEPHGGPTAPPSGRAFPPHALLRLDCPSLSLSYPNPAPAPLAKHKVNPPSGQPLEASPNKLTSQHLALLGFSSTPSYPTMEENTQP